MIISDSFGEIKTVSEKVMGFSQILGFRLFKCLGNRALAKGMASTYKADFAYRARNYFVEMSSRADLEQLILSRKAINKIDILDQLDMHDVPALILVGSAFGNAFIKANKKIADALHTELIVIKKSMDPSNLVNPEAFNRELLYFLRSK